MLDKDTAQELLENRTRREFLIGTGSIAAILGIASGEVSPDGDASITGGSMALEQAYKIAEAESALYIGPDSAKGNISPNDGDRYEAVDTQVVYHGDGGSWQGPQGIGSDSTPVPSVNTEEITTTDPATGKGAKMEYDSGRGRLVVTKEVV